MDVASTDVNYEAVLYCDMQAERDLTRKYTDT